MWHVSSRSGVATLRTAIHLLLTYLLTYLFTYTAVSIGGFPSGCTHTLGRLPLIKLGFDAYGLVFYFVSRTVMQRIDIFHVVRVVSLVTDCLLVRRNNTLAFRVISTVNSGPVCWTSLPLFVSSSCSKTR